MRNDTLELEDFDTILSPDIEFSGILRFEKPFLIRGRVSGEIDATGLLVIDEEAVVEANIKAARVIVMGTVRGNLTADERVEITDSGKLTGNINAPEIGMEVGCRFTGRCVMPEKKPAE